MSNPDSSAAATRQLWGGAVTSLIPARLLDVSDMRPVPDHQEAFLDPQIDQALIFEIVEQDANLHNDQAADFYFRDMAQGNDGEVITTGTTKHFDRGEVPIMRDASFVAMVSGTQLLRRDRTPCHACMLLVVIRLPQVQSDLLVSLSTPQQQTAAVAGAEPLMAQLLQSLKVNDWGLFGEGT